MSQIDSLTPDKLKKFPVKLALFDIDGTLVHGTESIPDEVIKELLRIKSQGIPVAFATGRPFFGAKWLAEKLQINEPSMFCSGSIICRPLSGEVLVADYLRQSETLAFLDQMEHEGFHTELYTKDDYFEERFTRFSVIHRKYLKQAPLVAPLREVATRDDLLKIVVVVERNEQEHRMREIIKDSPQYACGISTGDADKDIVYFNITNASASRDAAFDFYLKHYQVAAESVASFGDSEADMPFIRRSGYGVAMENALEPVKSSARYLTRDVESGGVAHALKLLVPRNG